MHGWKSFRWNCKGRLCFISRWRMIGRFRMLSFWIILFGSRGRRKDQSELLSLRGNLECHVVSKGVFSKGGSLSGSFRCLLEIDVLRLHRFGWFYHGRIESRQSEPHWASDNITPKGKERQNGFGWIPSHLQQCNN